MEEMTALQEKLDAGDLWDIDSRIEMAMDALRCPPNDWPVDKLSGGEKRRVAWTPRASPGCSITWRPSRAA
jgi:ATPase subunit of ABC transporter with duplicated ATPase domains